MRTMKVIPGLIAVCILAVTGVALAVDDSLGLTGIGTRVAGSSVETDFPSASVMINFEVFPDGSTVAGGTEITDQYAPWGVTFGSVSAPGATQVTNVVNWVGTTSIPNILVPGGPAPFHGGTLILEFLTSVTQVGSFIIDDQYPVQISAYDISGSVVGTASSDGSTTPFDSWQISYSAGIARVEMAGEYWSYPNSPDGWGIDDLAYTPIPEPTSMLLMGSGLIGLAGLARRKKVSRS